MAEFGTLTRYSLGSYGFYGAPARGDWEIFTIAANPDLQYTVVDDVDGQRQEQPSAPCHSKSGDAERNFTLLVQARVIAQ